MTVRKHVEGHLAFTRREFMIGAAGFTFAIAFPGCAGTKKAALEAPSGGALAPSAGDAPALSPWVSIATDGTVFIQSPATEMGQGSLTALPLILAEELDADWSKVRIVRAPPIDELYGNPGFGGMMYTAASNAVKSYFTPLRIFGAQVRRVLMENAARRWDVPLSELTTEPGVVVHAKSGRRLGYGEIAAFAQVPAKAPEVKPEELKKPSEFRLIGHDVMRVDLPSKVNGSAQYSIDVHVPGMLYGALVRTPVENGKPERVDDAAARAIPGVVRIVRMPYGVGVLAETPWAAFAARDALQIEWDRKAVGWGFDSEKGMDRYAAAARDLRTEGKPWDKTGDVKAAMAGAATVIEGEYRCDYAYHAQMEPLNSVASVSPSGDACEIWVGTQSQSMAVGAVAQALGISRDKVRLHDMLMGGGFGRRGHRDEEFVVDSILLSKEAKRPVKLMWTREDDLANGRFRPMSAHFLRAGLDASGRIVAWNHRLACDWVTPFMDPVRYKGAMKGNDFIAIAGTEIKTYDVPNRLAEQLGQDSGMRTSPLRGIGVVANKFATEAFLDDIAEKRGIDPVELRLTLLKNTPRGQAVIRAVMQESEFRRPRPDRSLGFAFADYADTMLAGVAEVSVDRGTGKIRIHHVWVAIDPGIAVQPDNVVAQTESSIVYGVGLTLSERITIKDGQVQQSNFYDYSVPRMSDVPEMHVKLMATPNPPTGVGQMATPLVAPAVASAVRAATRARLRHTPFTPERVLAAMKA
ncbi:MAG TPA: molybdopterin cofactor-binding domain-containing protein [Anaeromyxobacter sp.]